MGCWRNLLIGAGFLAMAGTALAQEARQASGRSPLSRWTRPTLTHFTGEAEFRNYLRSLREHEASAARPGRVQFAQTTGAAPVQSDAPPTPVCPPENPNCAVAADEGQLVVTGTRVSSANPSITNVQESGVDEGDIVKQIGKFLIVLQDGRLFVVDTRPGGQPGMAIADRANVYRNARQDTWYDEMLVSGDRVLITGYSYDEEATELSVFRLDVATGRLRREGIFFMSSNDYYDTENYASRLVDGNLVVYTPIALDNIDFERKIEWPVVRRWESAGDRTRPPRGRPLLAARDIYRPVRDVERPFLHTISICPLSGRNLDCRTTGFIGPGNREFHVSPTDAYLWTTEWPGWRGRDAVCAAGARSARSLPALLFRLPLDPEAEAGVVGVQGHPPNFLSLDTGGSRFRALLRWASTDCRYEDGEPLAYFDMSLDRFDSTLRDTPDRAYTAVPKVGATRIENRFTDHYLVYGGRQNWGSYPPDEPAESPSLAAAVPFDHPGEARLIPMPHSVLRVERVGDNVALTGYRDDSGLDVSLIDLRAAPRLASTVRMPGRYETEGRSHAFNSLAEEDGSAVMGVPTTHRTRQSGRWWDYSDASDVSFLAADATGRLAPLGELVAHANGPHADDPDDGIDDDGVWDDYQCEVSCIDWYGNSRPVFTDGRIFGLAGGELIEGRVDGGRIREVRRLNMTVGASRQP
jgi:hypothetical protein